MEGISYSALNMKDSKFLRKGKKESSLLYWTTVKQFSRVKENV